jgi:hypothetical protein
MVATTRRRTGRLGRPLTDSFRCVSGPLPLAVMGERLRLVFERPTSDELQVSGSAVRGVSLSSGAEALGAESGRPWLSRRNGTGGVECCWRDVGSEGALEESLRRRLGPFIALAWGSGREPTRATAAAVLGPSCQGSCQLSVSFVLAADASMVASWTVKAS